jgi:hypothetical protein
VQEAREIFLCLELGGGASQYLLVIVRFSIKYLKGGVAVRLGWHVVGR